jgi:hypothetical protein
MGTRAIDAGGRLPASRPRNLRIANWARTRSAVAYVASASATASSRAAIGTEARSRARVPISTRLAGADRVRLGIAVEKRIQ